MPRLQCKSFATPDEVRSFPSGRVEIILVLDGSGFSLESRGEHELKGLSGPRTVYALRR